MKALVDRDLASLLNRRGIRVEHTMTNLKKDRGEPRWEIDILAVNGDEAVEVQTTLRRQFDRLLEFLRDFPELSREYCDREVCDAVAYLKADESSASMRTGAVHDWRHRQLGGARSVTAGGVD